MKDLERLLNVIADFEVIWFLAHSSLYTDSHIDEYKKAKANYIEANY